MTDLRIAFVPSDTGPSDTGLACDLALRGDGDPLADVPIDLATDLATDAGLETAVIVSLFSDRRADPDDPLPDAGDDRRGWWGDAVPDLPDDRIGSRLWLLAREKQLPEVLARAEDYARQALAWLVEDGVAGRVSATASAPRPGVLALAVAIDRPEGPPRRFDYVWRIA